MSAEYPSDGDSELELLDKIANNTAIISEKSVIAATLEDDVATWYDAYCTSDGAPVIPPGVDVTSFDIVAGQSAPILLQITKDGNGSDFDSMEDYLVEILIKDANSDDALVVSKSTLAETVTASGQYANWTWSGAETAAFAPLTIFYVKLTDADGVSAYVAVGLLKIFTP